MMEEDWRLEWVRVKNGEVGGEFEGRWVVVEVRIG